MASHTMNGNFFEICHFREYVTLKLRYRLGSFGITSLILMCTYEWRIQCQFPDFFPISPRVPYHVSRFYVN